MNSGQGAARQAKNSRGLEILARCGYAVSGVLHLVLGWIVVGLGTGASGESASQSGALSAIAESPGGAAMLWFAVVAFAALALWQVAVAVSGSTGETVDRLKAAGKAIVYLALGFLALRFATGSGGGGGEEESMTATVMQNPAGQVLVGAVGLGIVGVGGYHVYKGWKKKFLEDLQGNAGGQVGRAVVILGQVGYVAKGVALGVLGALFVVAAVTSDPEQAGGLDEAFATIGEQPFGAVLLVATGLGFAAYGIYSFARARYARM